jgi:hypothetical protein
MGCWSRRLRDVLRKRKGWIIMAALIIVPVLLLLGMVYLSLLRPWQLTWGATEDEIARKLPGDTIVADPSFNATRAVTVLAPPEHIYPWIVQMGMGRAGWYSYDLLDNFGRRSAETILPEYQNVHIGDVVPMSPDGKFGLWVESFETNKWIVWQDKNEDVTWTWVIVPEDNSQCRLITRIRMKYRWLSPMAPFNLLVEFCDFPMMRKCMLGIKHRAESMKE